MTTPATGETGGQPPNLHSSDLINSLPAPLLRLLVLFARPIALGKVGLEVVLWKAGRRVESWMLIGIWWAICMGGTYAFRWLLPPLLFLPLFPVSNLLLGKKAVPPKHDAVHPTTHETLLLTLSDLHAIHALLPPSPLPSISSLYARFNLLGPLRLSRGFVILWFTWLTLGRIVGYRALLALIGSAFLLLPSPALAHVVDLLSRSLSIRRLVALTFLLVFGSPPDHSYPLSSNFTPAGWFKTKWATSRRPSLAFAFKPTVPKEKVEESAIVDDEDDEVPPIYFRFEVHENQRWWMGLDWTSALLPQERPSWCDLHLLPVSPPASFPLPTASSIVLPNPTKAEPLGRIKRVAQWKWLDDDWSIVRAGHGATGTVPTVQSSPAIPPDEGSGSGISTGKGSGMGTTPPMAHTSTMEEGQTAGAGTRAQSIAEHAFTKGLERFARATTTVTAAARPQSMIVGSPQRSSGEFKRGRTGSHASEDFKDLDTGATTAPVPTETIVVKDDATDADGWVYGDNKWENMGPRGGLGKFTRRRRWHRRAVLTETVIKLSPGPIDGPIEEIDETPPSLKAAAIVAPQPVVAETKPYTIPDKPRSMSESRDHGPITTLPPPSPTMSRDDVLRQRLKKVMGNVGG